MSNVNKQLDILHKLLVDTTNNPKVELRNINVSAIYLGDPIFFILPNTLSEKGILVKVDHNILSRFWGKEKLNRFIKKFSEKENSIIVSERPFLENITIQGNIDEVMDPFATGKNVRVINIKDIVMSTRDDWRRGSILFKEDDKFYLYVNEG